jgi:hypothetical protein
MILKKHAALIKVTFIEFKMKTYSLTYIHTYIHTYMYTFKFDGES